MTSNQQASWGFALRFLTTEQQEKLWEYIVLTDYGRRYVSPEKQASQLALLRQLVEQEQLDKLDLLPRLEKFLLIKARALKEGSPFLELFAD